MATKLVTTDTKRTALGEVRNGLAGNLDIVIKMIELVRTASIYDRGFERFVKTLAKQNGIDAHTSKPLVFQFVYNFVKNHVTYIQDAFGSVEYLKTPRQTLSDAYGDCDDNAVLLAAMLVSLGIEPYFVLARYDATHESFTHIYVAVYDQGKRYVFDTTLHNGELNDEVKAVATKEISIYDFVPQLDGVTGFIRQSFDLLKAGGKNALDVMPQALGLLPFGFGYVAGKALQTGAEMISNSLAGGLTYSETATAINRQLDAILRRLYKGEITIEEATHYANTQANRLYERKPETTNKADLDQIETTLKAKLNQIYNFGNTPNTSNIDVYTLDSKKTLLVGLAGLGIGLYFIFTNKD